MLSAKQFAARLGFCCETVRRHAKEWGAVKLPGGPGV